MRADKRSNDDTAEWLIIRHLDALRRCGVWRSPVEVFLFVGETGNTCIAEGAWPSTAGDVLYLGRSRDGYHDRAHLSRDFRLCFAPGVRRFRFLQDVLRLRGAESHP